MGKEIHDERGEGPRRRKPDIEWKGEIGAHVSTTLLHKQGAPLRIRYILAQGPTQALQDLQLVGMRFNHWEALTGPMVLFMFAPVAFQIRLDLPTLGIGHVLSVTLQNTADRTWPYDLELYGDRLL